MSRQIGRIATCVTLVIALTPFLAASQAQERSRTQGLKETDRFIKAGGQTSQKVAEAKNQVKSTLDTYNALVTGPSKNMKGDYKKLLKASDAMNEKVADARQKVTDMQNAGDTYFGGREAGTKDIQDPQLQARAQQRLADSRKEFAEVMQGLRDANDALEPFRKQLADQVTYLGSDLTPTATASLKPEAEKLNQQGADVFARTDQAIARANKYFQGLRATDS
jgi:hypothetical protein